MNTHVHALIDAYKKHLRTFLATHQLDEEYVRDIEARIQEKLDALERPDAESVSALLAEIGTPEEIFRDEITPPGDARAGLWQRFRDKTRGILFLGVFHTLSEMTNIGANWYRLGFLLLMTMGFFMGSPQVIMGLVALYGMGFLILRTGFFRFVFSLLMICMCLALLVPAILIFGMYLSGFHIENIALFSEFPVLFPIGMGLGILSLILFVVFFAAYALFRHAFGAKFFLVACITFVTALLCGVATAFHLMATYVTTPKILTYQTSAQPDPSKTTHLVNIDTSVMRDGLHGLPRMEGVILKGSNQFRLLPSEDGEIHITLAAKIFAATHVAERIQSYITGISAEVREGWGLTVQIEKDMKTKYPFAPIFVEVTEIKMPLHQRFTAKYWDIRWVNFSEIIFPEMEAFTPPQRFTIGELCPVYFFDDAARLNCEITPEMAREMARGMLRGISGIYLNNQGTYQSLMRQYHVSGIIRDIRSSWHCRFTEECEYNGASLEDERSFIVEMEWHHSEEVHLVIIYERDANLYASGFEILPEETTLQALERFFRERQKKPQE